MKATPPRFWNPDLTRYVFKAKRRFSGAVHALHDEIGSLCHDKQIDI